MSIVARLAPLLLLTAGTPAWAQWRAPAGARPIQAPATRAQPPVAPPSTGRLLAGGLLGGAVGAVVGGGVGAWVGSSRDCSAEEWVCAWHGLAVGAAVGTSVGIPLGAHVAGGRRGRLGASTLASLAIGAAGVALLAATHYDPPWAPVVLAATPAAQLAVSVAMERQGR